MRSCFIDPRRPPRSTVRSFAAGSRAAALSAVLTLVVSGGLGGCPSSESKDEGPASAPAPPSWASAQMLVTVVGSGQPGLRDAETGQGATAQFSKPIRLAPYAGGAVVVADIENHAIRLVQPDGKTRTLAGGPDKAGHADGPVAAAKLNSPHGVAILDDGSIAIAEASNHTLRRLSFPDGIDKPGVLETLAGVPGQAGFADGPAAKAKMVSPHGLLKLPGGALLVADIGNHRLRLFQDGKLTTVAGTEQKGSADGPLGTGTLDNPMALSLDADGSVLVVDASSPKIRRWTPEKDKKGKLSAGTLSTVDLAGSPLQVAHGVFRSTEGKVVVAQMGTHEVTVHGVVKGGDAKGQGAAGEQRRAAGTGVAGARSGDLNKPADVLVHGGRLWIADLGNHQLKHIAWPVRSVGRPGDVVKNGNIVLTVPPDFREFSPNEDPSTLHPLWQERFEEDRQAVLQGEILLMATVGEIPGRIRVHDGRGPTANARPEGCISPQVQMAKRLRGIDLKPLGPARRRGAYIECLGVGQKDGLFLVQGAKWRGDDQVMLLATVGANEQGDAVQLFNSIQLVDKMQATARELSLPLPAGFREMRTRLYAEAAKNAHAMFAAPERSIVLKAIMPGLDVAIAVELVTQAELAARKPAGDDRMEKTAAKKLDDGRSVHVTCTAAPKTEVDLDKLCKDTLASTTVTSTSG